MQQKQNGKISEMNNKYSPFFIHRNTNASTHKDDHNMGFREMVVGLKAEIRQSSTCRYLETFTDRILACDHN